MSTNPTAAVVGFIQKFPDGRGRGVSVPGTWTLGERVLCGLNVPPLVAINEAGEMFTRFELVPEGWDVRLGGQDWRRYAEVDLNGWAIVECRPFSEPLPNHDLIWKRDGYVYVLTEVGAMLDRTDLDLWECAGFDDTPWTTVARSFEAFGPNTWDDGHPIVVRKREEQR